MTQRAEMLFGIVRLLWEFNINIMEDNKFIRKFFKGILFADEAFSKADHEVMEIDITGSFAYTGGLRPFWWPWNIQSGKMEAV